MHEENFLSSWLREDLEMMMEDMEKIRKVAQEEENTSGKREVSGSIHVVNVLKCFPLRRWGGDCWEFLFSF